MSPRRSPLDAVHRALDAKMVEFGGWDMPVAYPSGTVAEHQACRGDAVVFDVSHLGTVRVTGAGAFELLQTTLTNDLARIGPGRAQYTHLLDDRDGGVLDDLIVWWVTGEAGDPTSRFDVMPNASNTDGVLTALGTDAVSAVDVTAGRAVLAVQGPRARQRLAGVAPEAAACARFRVVGFAWRGFDCLAAGTGYTGEDGVEIAVPAEGAAELWAAVAAAGVVPAGLGARDTLRLEAGLPLHGHELGPGITPLQARLGWVVAWGKPAFRGRDALSREREQGPARLLCGLVTDGRQPPREGYRVQAAGRGETLGTVTSGNFSPTLGHGIGLALLRPDVEAGTAVVMDARGRPLAATVSDLPFVPRG